MPISRAALITVVAFLAGSSGAAAASNGMLGYTFQTNRFTFQLGTINADGSGNHLEGPGRAQAVFSPDGNRELVFEFDGNGGANLFVRNVDGTGEVPLVPAAPGAIFHASWSPDGKRIAFLLSQPDNGADAEVWTMDADGSNQTQVTNDGYGKLQVDWGMTSSGSKIAYIGGRPVDPSDPCYGWQLWVIDPDGSNPACVSSVAAYGQSLAYGATDLEWSPDGTQFAMTASYPQQDPSVFAQSGNIWIAPRTGGTAVNLTPSTGYGELHALDVAWAPDATRLAVSGNIPEPDAATGGARFDGAGVYTLAPTGFPATLVTPAEPAGSVAGYSGVDWQPCTPGVTANCTSVTPPDSSPGPDPGEPGTDPGTAGNGGPAALGVRVVSHVIRFARSGTGKLRLKCLQTADPCDGTVKVRKKTRHGRARTLAVGTYSLAPDTTRSVRMTLRRAGKKALAHGRKAKRARLVLVSADGTKGTSSIRLRRRCRHCG